MLWISHEFDDKIVDAVHECNCEMSQIDSEDDDKLLYAICRFFLYISLKDWNVNLTLYMSLIDRM